MESVSTSTRAAMVKNYTYLVNCLVYRRLTEVTPKLAKKFKKREEISKGLVLKKLKLEDVLRTLLKENCQNYVITKVKESTMVECLIWWRWK